MTRPGETVTVHKCDAAGREVWSWPATVRRVTPTSMQVEARFNGPEGVLHGVTFHNGDRFVETYYADRWFNTFELFEGNSEHRKGWYCNITRPARFDDGHIRYEDLALDVLVLPDRTAHVLDEDEFEALVLTEHDRRKARQAIDELLGLARQVSGPFAAAPDGRRGSP